jgi:hypothetical protein
MNAAWHPQDFSTDDVGIGERKQGDVQSGPFRRSQKASTVFGSVEE